MTNRPIRLSIVTPLYNEEQVCGAFFSRLVPILTSVSGDYEIICVNDGSRDRTLELLRGAHASNPRVKVIDLTRNFGKELALTAGLDRATGDAVIPLDVDLQDPPELIPEMVDLWQQGYDVVLAVRSDRSSDSPFKRLTANVFYRLMGHISDIRLPPNAGDFRLMDRRVVAVPTYFVHVVNVMQSGEISQPIRSPSGFHLVKLLGVRGGKQVTITQTHVRHILIKITPTMSSAQARAKLERLRREIEQGASFATLAKANSDDTGSAVNGGDLGWVSPGQMVPQFQKMMNETPVGKISQPFRTPYGWHILEVLGRRQHDSTEQMVQARAKEIIFQRKRQEALNVWLRRIRDEAYVRILLKQNAG